MLMAGDDRTSAVASLGVQNPQLVKKSQSPLKVLVLAESHPKSAPLVRLSRFSKQFSFLYFLGVLGIVAVGLSFSFVHAQDNLDTVIAGMTLEQKVAQMFLA